MTSVLCMNVNAQFGPQQVITTNSDGANFVYAVDIDGDNDMDVVVTSWYDDKMSWFENTDGYGNFGTEQVITINELEGMHFIYASDLDGDGDMDLLVNSYFGDKVVWFENLNGLGSFGTPQTITTLTNGPKQIYASDLDGDGDMDVLSASYDDSTVAWYENINGQGNFGTQQIISNTLIGAWSILAIDIDNDGDKDVLAAQYGGFSIVWFENINGQGSFGPQQIITTTADSTRSLYAADLDNDGDMDVLAAIEDDDKIAWYENTDGQGNFGNQQIINASADAASSVYAVDIDGDGDMDVLSASYQDHKIAWYENLDGLGSFGVPQIIISTAYRAMSVYACDIDGDGDMDVLSASQDDDTVAWYENQHPLAVDENTVVKFYVYPNPARNITTISLKTEATYSLVNIQGQMIQEGKLVSGDNFIDVSQYPSGLYFINVKTEEGKTILKLIKQ